MMRRWDENVQGSVFVQITITNEHERTFANTRLFANRLPPDPKQPRANDRTLCVPYHNLIVHTKTRARRRRRRPADAPHTPDAEFVSQ